MTDIDIVDELRGFASGAALADAELMRDAAAEIERLRGEVEWEYTWSGEDWILDDEVFPSPQVAENWIGLLSTRRWVREEGGYLVRRHPAGPWERVEGDGDA